MFKNIASALYKALKDDKFVNCNCTSSATKFVLPNSGESITIKKTDSSANAITVVPDKGQSLDNATQQVETATVIGAITQNGNATIVVTAAGMAGSPLTLSVPVLNGDAIATTGGKIRNVLSSTVDITDMFTVSGSGANVVLTQIEPSGNDATLNISIDNGTCTGLTTAATSTNTTAVVAVTISTQNEYATFVNNGIGWTISDTGGVNATETLANKTIDSTLNYVKNTVMAYCANITTAQLNAGITLIAGVTGRTLRILRYSLVSNGAFNSGGGTSVILQDNNTSAVVVSTFAKAALTAGAKIASGSVITNVTDGAGMIGNLTASKGLVVPADASLSTGTSIDLTIYYMYV
jgi:hypothetical protein